jgi:hypothetical protein
VFVALNGQAISSELDLLEARAQFDAPEPLTTISFGRRRPTDIGSLGPYLATTPDEFIQKRGRLRDAVCAKLKQAILYMERNRLPLYRQLTLI